MCQNLMGEANTDEEWRIREPLKLELQNIEIQKLSVQ
jgi:hypothetical protein